MAELGDGVTMGPADRARSLEAATRGVRVGRMMADARWRDIQARRTAEERTRIAIEDAAFLASTGVGLTDAAARLEYRSPGALERLLERHDEYALAQRLRSQDPARVDLTTRRAS